MSDEYVCRDSDFLSICIVNYNTEALLNNCLRSIYSNSGGLRTEVIVIDNQSRDDSVDMVRELYPNVHLTVNQINEGYAHAVNQGLRQCSGNFILILNSDTIILSEALENTLRFLKGRDDAGIVGCRILNPDRTLQRSCRSYPSIMNYFSENLYLDKLFPRSRLFGRPFMSFFQYDHIKEVDVVLGAFMMMRRETVEQLGGMDDRFFMYSEETDYCYRARRHGLKNYFYPGGEIIHFGGQSTRQASTAMFMELHRSHLKFAEKYHGKVYVFAVKSILIIGILIRVMGSLILSLFKTKRGDYRRGQLHCYWMVLKWHFGTFAQR